MSVAAQVLVVTLGGACGVNARYWLSLLLARWLGTRFPWATFTINVSGSFAIGLVAVVLAERWPHPLVRIFALTGFLGGYTTFSAYMFESVNLWERGNRTLALGNLLGSVVAGLVAVVLGMTVARRLVETTTSTAVVEHRLEVISDESAGQSPTDSPAA